MKGYPQHLNTKADYMYVRANFPREQWLPDFQALLDSTHDWFFEKHLDTKEDGLEDSTHKVVEQRSSEDSEPTYDQYVFKEYNNALLFRLGFTVEEVEKLIHV